MRSKTFLAKLECLHEMLEFIESCSCAKSFTNETVQKIVLATEEALVNIINYSYPVSEGFIKISCKDAGIKPGLTILIKDGGIPFNPIQEVKLKKNSLPPLPSLDEKSKKGGYGIYIFVGVMDRVDYKRLDDGNLLAMTKYLP